LADEYVVSVVLEGNSTSLESASNRGARSQDKLKKSTQEANIEFLAQVARYQAMTAALNQTVGGFNKLAGAMDRLGFKEQGEQIRQFTAYLELVAGPAEIYLAYLTLSIALGQKDALTKGKQTAATGTLTKAQLGLNAALRVNPYVMLITVVVSLVSAFLIFGKGIDNTKTRVELLTDAVKRLREAFEDLLTFQNPFDGAFESRFGADARGRNTGFIRELMGA
tara:strand:- start:507 stop:1175 length:669 start_codon:yes stop_codon:yes gene_type:complete